MSPTSMVTEANLLTTPSRRAVAPPRSRRMVWLVLLGIVLLVSSLFGASLLVNQGLPTSDAQKKADVLPRLTGVFAHGLVDADPKVADLNPSQQGRIVWLIEEGKPADKGQVLLRIDNGAALSKVEEAKAALAAAQAKLDATKRPMGQPSLMQKQLEFAINAAKEQKKIAELEHEQAKKAHKLGQADIRVVQIAEANVKRAEAALYAEENKRFQLDLEARGAEANFKAAEAQLAAANWYLEQHELKAPFDGTVLRVLVSVGEQFTGFQQVPAIQFCPNTPRIVRAEVLQEWSHMVKDGQEVVIEDDTKVGYKWKGRVKSVSDWITERRSKRLEPFNMNDVRTLECIIEVTGDERTLRIGQRVRVTIIPDGKEKVAAGEQ